MTFWFLCSAMGFVIWQAGSFSLDTCATSNALEKAAKRIVGWRETANNNGGHDRFARFLQPLARIDQDTCSACVIFA